MSDLDPAADAIEDAAEEAGMSREELLKRALVALADAEGIDVPDAEEVAAIEARLDEIDAELDEKVDDLRERFVELYREVEALEAADATAGTGTAAADSADGTAGDTAARLDDLASEVDALAARFDDLDAAASPDRVADLASEVAELDTRVAELAGRLDAVDSRLDELPIDELPVDELATVDDKLSRVASAVVRIRRRLEAAERDRGDRERVDALTRTANRSGIRRADCDHCGGTVDVGLLSAPECPHCGWQFTELEPNTGFLGTSRLLVTDPPAIDGDVGGEDRTEADEPGDFGSAAASDGGADGDRR